MPTDRLNSGESLFTNLCPGDGNTNTLVSPNGLFQLIMQDDGNLVLYSSSGHGSPLRPRWDSGTSGRITRQCTMQRDGNLVIQGPSSNPVVWASNTSGNPNAHLVIQDDGNVVIQTPDGNAVWATNTVIL